MTKLSIITLGLSALCILTFDWLPLALLTPIRLSLGLSVPQMGVTLGWFGFLTFVGSVSAFFLSRFFSVISLLRILLLLMGGLSFLIALYPSVDIFILGRLVGGAVFGSFWTITTAASFSLNEQKKKDTLSSLYMGNAITLAAILPLAVFGNSFIDWRLFFYILALSCLVVALFSNKQTFKNLSSFTTPFSEHLNLISSLYEGVKEYKKSILISFLSIGTMFAGCACIYPYFRVLFERNTHLLPSQFSYIFALEGIAGIVGVQVLKIIQQKFPLSLEQSITFLICLLSLMGGLFFLFVQYSLLNSLSVLCLLVICWGFGLNAIAFLWPLWLAKFKNFEPFALIAIKIGFVQLSVMFGTWVGAYNISQHWGNNFIVGCIILLVAVILSLITFRTLETNPDSK